jgi:predicted secreted protein
LAIFVATDHKVTINGTNFSDHLTAVTLDVSTDEQDVTAFGTSGYRTRIAGLKDASIQLDFNQDFGSASIDATLWPLLGSNATVVITPTSGTVSATNPSYSGVYLVSKYSPVANTVGDVATLSVTWPLAGTAGVTRGTV